MLKKLTVALDHNGIPGLFIYHAKEKKDGTWEWVKGRQLDWLTIADALGLYYEKAVRHHDIVRREDMSLINALKENRDLDKDIVDVLFRLLGGTRDSATRIETMIDWEAVKAYDRG